MGELEENQLLFALRHPFTFSIVGPTMSGKTKFVLDLIEKRRQIINENIDRIIYIYTEDQPLLKEFSCSHPYVEFTKGMEILSEISDSSKKTLLIFDDKMLDFCGKENEEIVGWFIKGAHHRNCSVIVLLQNMYPKNLRTIGINSMYLAYFNNPRDAGTISQLGKQIYPGRPRFLVEAYERIVGSKPYAYIFFDFHQQSNNRWRVRSSLYPIKECEVFSPAPE